MQITGVVLAIPRKHVKEGLPLAPIVSSISLVLAIVNPADIDESRGCVVWCNSVTSSFFCFVRWSNLLEYSL